MRTAYEPARCRVKGRQKKKMIYVARKKIEGAADLLDIEVVLRATKRRRNTMHKIIHGMSSVLAS